jgi:hypothetical protein
MRYLSNGIEAANEIKGSVNIIKHQAKGFWQ